LPEQQERVRISDLLKRLVEQVSFEARSHEYVDKKSGVSARLTIAAYENLISTAERRAILHRQPSTQVWVSDLSGIIPSITGKIELLYEGEQEGSYQVALHLLDKAIRTIFVEYFPNPEQVKKKRNSGKASAEEKKSENPYQSVIRWFDAGNVLELSGDLSDEKKIQQLYRVEGLHALVKKFFPAASEAENALLMEFVLYGLSVHSMISKKLTDDRVAFRDLMGSMMNLGNLQAGEEEDYFSDDENR
jgi:magnesium chelatase subunit I